jgi:Dullard-like phosphatase family protein
LSVSECFRYCYHNLLGRVIPFYETPDAYYNLGKKGTESQQKSDIIDKKAYHSKAQSSTTLSGMMKLSSNQEIEANSFKKLLQSIVPSKSKYPEFVIQPDMNGDIDFSEDYFLPPIHSEREYTLVLDLDETLIHYEEISYGKGKVHVRPFVDRFLQQLSTHYEIVIFTASVRDYADHIIDQIDEGNWITHRLYREHTTRQGEIYFKDLRRLGRDLSKTIIVDNNSDNFALQPSNGILIPSFTGDHGDFTLVGMAQRLAQMVSHNRPADIRHLLADYGFDSR